MGIYVKAVCFVAHPDDCVIFAKPFIDYFAKWNWHIFYLTYELFHPRVKEMSAYWHNKRNIPVTSLGYVDTHLDMENNKISFNEQQAAQEIKNICQSFDLALTHNSDGDYGHIHHKFVSQSVTAAGKPTVYFANHLQANLELKTDKNLNLNDFSLHKQVIEDFKDINVGRYCFTDSVGGFLK